MQIMRKSIRFRIAITFFVLMALVLFLIGVLQHAFLEDFYYRDKQKTLSRSLSLIEGAEGIEDIPESFEQFCSVNSLTYCLTDSSMSVWQTNSSYGSLMASNLLGIILGQEDENSEVVEETDSYTILQIENRYTGLPTLELWSILPSGNYYLVTCPVESMAEAAETSMRFYLYIGILAALGGAVVIWLVSGYLEQTVTRLQTEKRTAAAGHRAEAARH